MPAVGVILLHQAGVLWQVDLSLWPNGLILSALGVGAVCSVRERRKKRKWRSTGPQTLQSPLSQALAQLVGTAGGIYLSLELLCSFLGVRYEEWPAMTSLAINPLAAGSLVIAIIQPFVAKAWNAVRRGIESRKSASVVSPAKGRKDGKRV